MARKKRYKMTRDKLDMMEEDLQFKKQEYLVERGWEYTCRIPGSFWVYKKKLKDGGVVLCPQNTAMGIQEWIEELGKEV